MGDRYAKKKKLNNKIRHGLLGLPPSPQPPRERAGAESRTTAPSLPRRPVAGLLPPRRSAHGRPARPPPWLGQEPSESRPACCSRRGGGCGGGSPPALTVRLRGRRASQGGRAGGRGGEAPVLARFAARGTSRGRAGRSDRTHAPLPPPPFPAMLAARGREAVSGEGRKQVGGLGRCPRPCSGSAQGAPAVPALPTGRPKGPSPPLC